MTIMQARGPGRPREDHVPTRAGDCPKHGKVQFRIHKNGRDKTGKQRYHARCPACHNEKNQSYYQ